jgi:hypothetical protein
LGINLYFLNSRVHKWIKHFPDQENDNWENFARMRFNIPKNVQQDETKNNSSNQKPIAMNNVQIPIMP